jgi:hypothetical protein
MQSDEITWTFSEVLMCVPLDGIVLFGQGLFLD